MMKYSVYWSESRGVTPLLSNGQKEMVFDKYEDAKKFFDHELMNTTYRKLADLGRKPTKREESKYTSQLELVMWDPQDPAVCEDLELVDRYLVAGSDFATGRPFTGRTKALSVRISEEAYNMVKKQKNKSEYIDKLIRDDYKRKKGRQE